MLNDKFLKKQTNDKQIIESIILELDNLLEKESLFNFWWFNNLMISKYFPVFISIQIHVKKHLNHLNLLITKVVNFNTYLEDENKCLNLKLESCNLLLIKLQNKQDYYNKTSAKFNISTSTKMEINNLTKEVKEDQLIFLQEELNIRREELIKGQELFNKLKKDLKQEIGKNLILESKVEDLQEQLIQKELALTNALRREKDLEKEIKYKQLKKSLINSIKDFTYYSFLERKTKSFINYFTIIFLVYLFYLFSKKLNRYFNKSREDLLNLKEQQINILQQKLKASKNNIEK